MPRASKEQSAVHRKTITDASARLMRERGIQSVSVAELMGAAGLTHGGFYGHFESKDALAAEACGLAFSESVDKWQKRIAGHSDDAGAFKAIVEAYLSVRTRDAPSDLVPTARTGLRRGARSTRRADSACLYRGHPTTARYSGEPPP